MIDEAAIRANAISRRAVVTSGAVAAAGVLVGCARDGSGDDSEAAAAASRLEAVVTKTVGEMPYRRFGRTGMEVSEVGFGSWAIGGGSYGAVERADSLSALARAEELGCNFVDTALVYGESELVIGEFLKGRRDKWLVATKYSGQKPGMTAAVEQQLQRLCTDHIDFYQIHWAPHADGQALYDELYRLKQSGKVRFVGVSLHTPQDIDYVIDHTQLDGVQMKLSLLDPLPFLARARRLREAGLGIIARSSLKEGFLTGKFKRDVTFTDPGDQRSKWSRERIAETVDQVEKLRFLEQEQGSMLLAAARYPLSFPEVSTVILGTKSASYADSNYGEVPGGRLTAESMARVAKLQDELGLWGMRERLLRQMRRVFRHD